MKLPRQRLRLPILVGVLVALLSAWAVAWWEMRALVPTLEGHHKAIVADCAGIFSALGEEQNQYRILSDTSVRREFTLFGIPRGTVTLTVSFTDARGDEQTVTGYYHLRREAGSWWPETVTGYDVMERVGREMERKHPLEAFERRRAFFSALTGAPDSPDVAPDTR